MSRSITINVVAKKGAAHRALRRAVEGKLAAIGGDRPEKLLDVVEAARVAAYKVIPVAGRSDQLEIQLHAQEGPTGGWSVSILVDNPDPTFAE